LPMGGKGGVENPEAFLQLSPPLRLGKSKDMKEQKDDPPYWRQRAKRWARHYGRYL